MPDKPAHEDPMVLAHYEGLIRTTAARIAPHVGDDYDDVVQLLRIKVWRSLQAYNPKKCRTSRDSFVFSCVYNHSKDILKAAGRMKRQVVFIEDLSGGQSGEAGLRDSFEGRYLTLDPDQAFREVEETGVQLPDTLTDDERMIVYLLYLEFSKREIAQQVGLTARQVDRRIQSIRDKMEDWRPSALAA